MSKKTSSRGQFSSTIGFVISSAGAAVGLGNIWKFPYIAGKSGGGIFVIIYVLFALILGIPLIIAETAIGRKTGLNPIGAYKKLNKKWTFIGVFGILTSFLILSYYSVVGGWVIKYFFAYLTGKDVASDSSYFTNFITDPVEPVIWHIIFMAITAFIVVGGVAKGIEKVNKVMLPGLFILVIIIAIRSITLKGASEGLKFFLLPHFNQLSTFEDAKNVLSSALGQIFFSLNIGIGISITYGSYLQKDSNIPKNSFVIAGLDTLIALLAGLAILPAVFAFGFEPAAGPGLIFQTLPSVFESFPAGRLFAILFFALIFFAAITSSISMLEVVTAYFIDTFGVNRKKATIILAIIMGLIGIVSALSFGPLADFKIFGNNFFDFLSVITDKFLMPLGGIFTCIFVGHIYKTSQLEDEIATGTKSGTFKMKKVFNFLISWICPILLIIIFLSQLF